MIGLTIVWTVVACGGDDDTTATIVTTTSAVPASTTPGDVTVPSTTAPVTTPPTTAPDTSAPPATTPETSAPATTTTAPITIDVNAYFLRDERLAIARRDVEGPAVLRASLEELLAGPSEQDATAEMFTAIPTGTELLDIALADGTATIDLSREFDSGGGSMSMLARITQVVFTATQFDNVDEVLFWMEGEPVDFLGGEGIVLSEPFDRSSTPRTFTDGILFAVPEWGTTVSSPFVVSGEGDVFEGDFPLFVRRDGEQIGETMIVRAGAWGEWDEFDVTIELDDEPGPIEIVAVVDTGCSPPECDEAPDVVLPLVLG